MERDDGANVSRESFVLRDFHQMLFGLSHQRRNIGIASSTHAIDKNYEKNMSETPTEGWPDNIKMNLKLFCNGVDWIHVVMSSRCTRGGLLWTP